MKCLRIISGPTFHLMGATSSSGSACFRTEPEPKSLSRALFALGPDDEDLPEDEICDSIGEIINIMAGLVKSHMEAKEIPCKIGLPHYLDSATEVNARARRQQATIRIGPVSVYLAVVRVQ